jgi:predicted DNA-binding transcriptional regulator AlpA
MTLIGIAQLRAKGVNLDDTSIWRKEKTGEFPKHVIVGNKRAWVESEVDQYIADLIAKRDATIHADDGGDVRNLAGDELKNAEAA